MTSVDIIIVNYNAGDHILKCLESINKLQHEAEIKIWVVDNNSSDQSPEKVAQRFPKVNLLRNSQNLGFGKANNLAIKKSTAEFILILNPDTILEPGTVSFLTKYLEEFKVVGAASGKVVFDNGEIDLTAHRGFPTPWASFLYFLGNDRLYHLSDQDMTKIHEVDSITGAFFFTRKSVLDKVGLFDEDYFMYAEDLDLCYRIKTAGYKIVYIPSIKVVHHKGISSGLKKLTAGLSTADLETKKRSLSYFYKTMKIFYSKHLEEKYPFFINWLVYFGINIKWLLAKRKLEV